jgi:hypothetical protein
MTNKEIAAAAKSFNANPPAHLGALVDSGEFTSKGYQNLARVLNAAGFNCRTLNVQRWTAQRAMQLVEARNNSDLCSELAARAPLAIGTAVTVRKPFNSTDNLTGRQMFIAEVPAVDERVGGELPQYGLASRPGADVEAYVIRTRVEVA